MHSVVLFVFHDCAESLLRNNKFVKNNYLKEYLILIVMRNVVFAICHKSSTVKCVYDTTQSEEKKLKLSLVRILDSFQY